MKISLIQKVSIIPLFIGLILVSYSSINKMPSEVLRSNIPLGDLSANRSTPGIASASYFYFENYEQADEMVNTIVIGDVIKVNEPEELVTGEAINTITGEKVPISHVYTVSEIKVSKAVKGKYSPGDIIKVKQYGGLFKGKEYKMNDVIYFKTGERHIFFLQSYENSPCSAINPQQGDMLIVDGKIKATNKIQFINDNVSEDAAEKALKEKVESKN